MKVIKDLYIEIIHLGYKNDQDKKKYMIIERIK